jgi:ABC-type nitrate/sulfonate/bicarbonate transport system permease component
MKALRRGVIAVLAAVGVPAVLLTAWWVASANSTDPFWPPLSTTLSKFFPTWFGDRLMSDVLPGLGRLAAGYAIAVVVGVLVGGAIGNSKAIRELVEPVLDFLRSIPPPVLIPVATLFLGIGDSMRIVVIAAGCLWPIMLNTVAGVRSLEPVLAETAAAYRIGWSTRVFGFILPAASPQIFAGARQALSIGVILMVISEMFVASSGIGFTIIQFSRRFAIPEMWTGIFLLGIIGVLLMVLFVIVERRTLAWYFGLRASERKG